MVTASSRRAPKYYRSSEAITGTMSGYGFAVGSSGYDDEDRLVNWERDDTNLDQSWSLSLVGDWSSITENSSTQLRTHGSAHQILTAASQSITHDVKGNMTSIPAVLRPGSDPLALSWDFDNRMTGADVDNDSTDDVTYQFDALGRRVQRDDGTDETIFVQNGQQTFADYASGTAATSSDYNYVYASYIDEPVYRDGTGGSRYYHRGQQYSITALTDSVGSIKERYTYSAYGGLTIFDAAGTVRSSTAEGNRYAYTGREWDDVAEIYHYRARMYDPVMGRFLGRDRIGYEGSPWNLYEYVSSMPLAGTDPTGERFRRGVRTPWVWPWFILPFTGCGSDNGPNWQVVPPREVACRRKCDNSNLSAAQRERCYLYCSLNMSCSEMFDHCQDLPGHWTTVCMIAYDVYCFETKMEASK